jgi:hypothetical protein
MGERLGMDADRKHEVEGEIDVPRETYGCVFGVAL